MPAQSRATRSASIPTGETARAAAASARGHPGRSAVVLTDSAASVPRLPGSVPPWAARRTVATGSGPRRGPPVGCEGERPCSVGDRAVGHPPGIRRVIVIGRVATHRERAECMSEHARRASALVPLAGPDRVPLRVGQGREVIHDICLSTGREKGQGPRDAVAQRSARPKHGCPGAGTGPGYDSREPALLRHSTDSLPLTPPARRARALRRLDELHGRRDQSRAEQAGAQARPRCPRASGARRRA